MDYVGRIYRPPSEAHSLLLQVTVGCSHNRCSYCDMYRDKQFRAKPKELIEQDLREAAALGPVDEALEDRVGVERLTTCLFVQVRREPAERAVGHRPPASPASG